MSKFNTTIPKGKTKTTLKKPKMTTNKAGFSEKVFDIMQILKEDKKALINEVKSVEI